MDVEVLASAFNNLKSNMDRFIVFVQFLLLDPLLDLKSNMDRFIVQNRNQSMFCIIDLKSNMDRFIAFQTRNIITG